MYPLGGCATSRVTTTSTRPSHLLAPVPKADSAILHREYRSRRRSREIWACCISRCSSAPRSGAAEGLVHHIVFQKTQRGLLACSSRHKVQPPRPTQRSARWVSFPGPLPSQLTVRHPGYECAASLKLIAAPAAGEGSPLSERGGCADDGAEFAVFNEPRPSAFACFIRVSEESFRGQISLPLHCPVLYSYCRFRVLRFRTEIQTCS